MKNILTILFLTAFLFSACKKEKDTTPVTSPVLPVTNTMILDEFEGLPIVLVGNQNSNFITGFQRTLEDGTLLDFTVLQSSLPLILEDNEGNKWDFFGRALEGPRVGESLQSINGYIGFWFSWGSMYPGVTIYDGPDYSGDYIGQDNAPNWTIPTDNVIAVLSQDAIPAIDNPVFEIYDNRVFIETGEYFLEDDDIVIGVAVGNKIRLYPQRILNWHEVVNDKIGDFEFSLSFCPLTATSVLWDRNLNGNITTFGVSGLLYNSNVIVFDRSTQSLWSQMKYSCINGSLNGTNMKTQQVLESTWRSWKVILESPNVMTTNTGISKDYTVNPYEDYLANESHLSYPISYKDERLPLKERVFGVIVNGKAKVYQFKDF